jgi:hypothetical protein
MPSLSTLISPLDLFAHVKRVALTPVFLLSGITTLLNVFSTRLARVADLIAKATNGSDVADIAGLGVYLSHLRRRSLALDVAVVFRGCMSRRTTGAWLT